MSKTLAEKVIAQHLTEGKMKPGKQIGLKIDHTLTQDSTGTLAYLEFEAMGVPRVITKLSLSFVDHNMLQNDFRNADDHRYLQDVAAKYGIVFSRPGNGICHQIHLERFAKPGKVTQVAFPLWWDFQNFEKKKRGMSFFPLFWRFERPGGDHTVILNGYYWKGEGKSYRFSLFPLFGFGESEKSRYWKVLLGLVGFRTSELKDTLYLFWLPIKVRDDTPKPE